MGALSIWHWLVILAIVLVIFGTKKLRNIGSDLGGAIKHFKQAMKEESEGEGAGSEGQSGGGKKKGGPRRVIEGKVTAKETTKDKKKT